MMAATSWVVRPKSKYSKQRPWILGRRLALQARIEVGDHHVVGFDRLKTTRFQTAAITGLEEQGWRGVADSAIAVSGLSLEFGCRATGRTRLRLVLFVLGQHVGIVDEADDPVGVDAGHAGEHFTHLLVVVKEQPEVEVGQLQSAKDAPFAAGPFPAGGDHGPAGA